MIQSLVPTQLLWGAVWGVALAGPSQTGIQALVAETVKTKNVHEAPSFQFIYKKEMILKIA